MSTEALEKTAELTNKNGNGTLTQQQLVVHRLGIKKDELIPRSCRNCHCLQTGLRKGRLILIGETIGSQRWIICRKTTSISIDRAIRHLTKHGINEDLHETATNARLVKKRSCDSLFSLLNEEKDPGLKLKEVRDNAGDLVAFYLE